MEEKGHYDPERRGWVTKDGGLIRVNSDDNKARISIYDGDERAKGGHSRDTINIDYKTGKGSIDSHNNDKSEKTSDSVGCYLTSACMRHYMEQFDDNCYYLDILRWFRDTVVSLKDKKLYYKIAPRVVEVLDKLENSDEVYTDIYYNVIQKCVRLIEYGNYDEAYSIYKDNVKKLERQYVLE